MSSIWVIAYNPLDPSRVQNTQLYLWKPAADVAVAAVETQPHFIGKFQPPNYLSASGKYLWNAAKDVPVVTAQPETQPHFIGKFQPPGYLVRPGLFNWISATDLNAPAGGSTSFIAPFTQVQILPPYGYLLWNSAQDTSTTPVVQSEAQPHFIGKFQPTNYLVRASLYNWKSANDIQNLDVSSSFIGQFIQSRILTPDGYLLWNSAQDTSAVVVVQSETQPHFLAKHQPTKYLVPPGFYNWVLATDVNVPPGGSTSFLAPFTQGQILPPYGYLLWNSAKDVIFVAQVEAQPHFIGKFQPSSYLVRPGLNNWISATDLGTIVIQAETQPHFIGRFQPPQYLIPNGRGLYNWVTIQDFNAPPPPPFVPPPPQSSNNINTAGGLRADAPRYIA